MDKQKLRDKRIYSRLNLDKLPFNLDINNFKVLGQSISLAFKELHTSQVESEKLRWCFSTIKKFKIFLEIFYANEAGKEIYKEEIAKKIQEYSYKTISKIIDEGHAKGYYVNLKPDGETGTDAKIKNIRPSEDLVVDFLNWNINVCSSINKTIKNNKTSD
tara:strand:+ start:771 stop:1250 length:480 start_codon:yes stop_codon:yes gene_type:complete